jgi:hypothetical protein
MENSMMSRIGRNEIDPSMVYFLIFIVPDGEKFDLAQCCAGAYSATTTQMAVPESN